MTHSNSQHHLRKKKNYNIITPLTFFNNISTSYKTFNKMYEINRGHKT